MNNYSIYFIFTNFMKTLFVIRHGKESLEGSDRERGLTIEGIEHAKQISDILLKVEPKIQKIFTSPLRRAILTIEPFSQATNLEIKIIEELHEKITGDTEGRNLNEEKKKMWETTKGIVSGKTHILSVFRPLKNRNKSSKTIF